MRAFYLMAVLMVSGCGLKPSAKQELVEADRTLPTEVKTTTTTEPTMTASIAVKQERPTNTPLDFLSVASAYRHSAFSTVDKRYKGQLVYVNDRVWCIGEENGRPYIGVYGDDKVSPMMYCFFENDTDIDQFHVGKRTSIEGIVMGAVRDNVYRPKASDNFHVVVDQCRIK
jgi:hypothetical protein